MSTRDIRTTGEIVINIGRGAAANADAARPRHRKGGDPGHRPNDGILKRRRSRSLINFYDLSLARIGDGYIFDYSSVDAAAVPVVGSLGATIPIPAAGSFDSIIAAELAAAGPAAEWKSKFYKLKKGVDQYDSQIQFSVDNGATFAGLNTSDKWTADGLNLTGAEVAGLRIDANSVLYKSVIDFGSVYYTATFDAGAPHVAFTPGPAMDIFLVAQPILGSAEVFYYSGYHNDGINPPDYIHYSETLGGVAAFLDRGYLADYNSIRFYDAYFTFLDYVRLIQSFAGLAGLIRVRDFDTGGVYHIYDSSFSPGTFPTSSIYTTSGLNESPSVPPWTMNQGYSNNFAFLGSTIIGLKAIIQTAAQTVFVW